MDNSNAAHYGLMDLGVFANPTSLAANFLAPRLLNGMDRTDRPDNLWQFNKVLSVPEIFFLSVCHPQKPTCTMPI